MGTFNLRVVLHGLEVGDRGASHNDVVLDDVA